MGTSGTEDFSSSLLDPPEVTPQDSFASDFSAGPDLFDMSRPNVVTQDSFVSDFSSQQDEDLFSPEPNPDEQYDDFSTPVSMEQYEPAPDILSD